MRWLVRCPKKRRWFVLWHHNTENASWWSELVIDADTAEEAAQKVLHHVDFEEHTSYRNKTMRVRVFGPIPDDHKTFEIAPAVAVEAVANA